MDIANLENAMSPQLKSRWESLLDYFRKLDSVVVAFSGGVDSGLLCAAAYRALGERMLAVTVSSPVESLGDVESASRLAEQVGFPLRILDYDDLSNPEFVSNPPDRCYVCKLVRFQRLRQLATEAGFAVLVEGSNADDLSDYRPGRKAVTETGTVSPLLELGFSKDEIRALAKAFGLSVWDRPSAPCLATRFPYGSPITREGLRQVANGERYLHENGFRIVRVRHHGVMARLEVAPGEIKRLVAFREDVTAYFKSLGFTYISVDLSGYRLGSLNEVLK
ncbi:Pyridinium-3,5-bisthiocarboxylic acid mononucleotide synthase [Anaerolineales bacterium]|nr:Pyridinium-3,5-bisthiocarboxylic acid mononucleotide synthase [Anaerolineales bacterium]